MANIKKLVTFSPRTLEMVEAIKKQAGFTRLSEVSTRGIEELYKSTFKYGTDPLLGGSTGGSNTDEAITTQAERKVKLKLAQEKVAQDLKDKEKIDRCVNELGGEVIINPDGSKLCQWFNLDSNGNDTEQTIPLHQCGAYLLDNLFYPDKETVLKARPELKKKFK